MKFQDQIFSKFQDIFVSFTRLKTQKMHDFLCSQILISQTDQYCSHKNVESGYVQARLYADGAGCPGCVCWLALCLALVSLH